MFAGVKQLFLRSFMHYQAGTSATPSLAPAGSEVRNIDVWQFGGVGDMLLATPVIRALGCAYPDAAIRVWCSDPVFAGFLGRIPKVEHIDRFPVYDFDARTLFRHAVRTSLQAIRDEMRAIEADVVVNLHIPALLDWWAVEWWLIRQLQPRYALGFDPRFIQHGSIYQASLNASVRDGLHYTKLYGRLMDVAGIPCDERTEFPLRDSDRERASELLAEHGLATVRRRVCLHIGGRRLKVEGRMWPVERFADLASRLLANDMVPVLVGVQNERPMGEQLCDKVPECINLIGCTNLDEMAALVSLADGFVGHDSGPFHVAVAVGTPCVAICGRPDAEPEYLNYERDDVAALIADAPELISTDAVMQQAMRLFGHA